MSLLPAFSFLVSSSSFLLLPSSFLCATLGDVNLAAVFPPMATPFDQYDEVDVRAIAGNVERWTRAGVGGVVALGSNGEAPLLDESESDRVIDAVRGALRRGLVLIAGTGRESTRATIAASRRAASLGADAVLVRTPSYFKGRMTPDAFTRHYRAVADASPVPVLLYNYPAVTGVNLAPETVGTPRRAPQHRGYQGDRHRHGAICRIRSVDAVDVRRDGWFRSGFLSLALRGRDRRHPRAGVRCA